VWKELPAVPADWGEDAEKFASKPRERCWQMHEFSRSRMTWDLLGLLLLLYDAFATPWQVAFGELAPAEVMAWLLPVYWTANFILTCCFTTFSSGGVLQTRKKAMFLRYATQSFLMLDLLTTGLDILVLAVRYDLSQSTYQVLRSFVQDKDIFLAIQSVRLLRTLRINRNLLGVRARVRSEAWRALGGLAVSCLLLLVGAHIVACALYYLGSASGGNAATWLQDYAQTQQQEDNVSMYFAAFLWALAQLTPGLGPSPVNPRSMQDLVFTSVVHVLALLCLLCILLQVAGVALRLERGKFPRHQVACRAYLSEGPRPAKDLQQHIWSWLETEPRGVPRSFRGWQGPRCLEAPAEPSQSPLAALPVVLRQELMGQLGTPLLTLHPFFHELDVAHPQAIKEVINCLQQRFYSPTQDIFVASSIAKCMYVIAKGMASYAKEANFLSPKRRPDVRVAVGQHVAEGGLWLENWAHLGTLTVAGLEDGCCEVLSLDSLSFGTLLRRGPCELWQAASSYARAFARRASDGISDLDADTEGLMKITDEAFADALRFLAQEAGRDCGEGAGPVSP